MIYSGTTVTLIQQSCMIDQLQVTLFCRHRYFYMKKKAQYKISILRYCSKGDRCPQQQQGRQPEVHRDAWM